MALLEAINLNTQLSKLPKNAPQPYTYHERTGHELIQEKSKVYLNLKETEEYAKTNKMKINYKKTKLMIFNPARAKDFYPRFLVNDGELEIAEERKF